MPSRVADPTSAYHRKNLLIDSNLLLLFFVGLNDRTRIAKFKRTAQFTVEDFECLIDFVKKFKGIVTTPSILTEVSNLLGQLPDELRTSFHEQFAHDLKDLHEHYTASRELAGEKSFPRFGLTDTAILQAATSQCLVLTDDLRLYQYLGNLDVDVINFNHIRTYK